MFVLNNMTRRNLISMGAGCGLLQSVGALAANKQVGQVHLKASVDTSGNHVRNLVIEGFAKRLVELSGGQLSLSIFPSGQLYKDRDTPKGLYWGLIDFAVPAITKLARYDSHATLYSLPFFFGASTRFMHELIDSQIGKSLIGRIEKSLNLKILGNPIDLGHTHVFTTRKNIHNDSELRGLKIRIPGGRGSLALYNTLGANPVVIPFADLPLALSQGNVDAVQSSHESIRSGKLWEAGIRYCYEDHSSFLNYMPLVSRRLWDSLPRENQSLMQEVWQESVVYSRELAASRQKSARDELIKNGVTIVPRPGPPEADLLRDLIDVSKQVSQELKLSETMVNLTLQRILVEQRSSGI